MFVAKLSTGRIIDYYLNKYFLKSIVLLLPPVIVWILLILFSHSAQAELSIFIGVLFALIVITSIVSGFFFKLSRSGIVVDLNDKRLAVDSLLTQSDVKYTPLNNVTIELKNVKSISVHPYSIGGRHSAPSAWNLITLTLKDSNTRICLNTLFLSVKNQNRLTELLSNRFVK